ncbi:flavohemoglobin [Oceanobacillus iheyensis HTE831]|uniref:Flavohemoprotein n=1 Tax=Oceanobacillus iheyensis (strain DSM 14371 / CIP 107618 / JCM 11309 / KCTC 3954 / HTE831) TaxID=221109 RepID=HMP_OCEIH|nr:NO-inducible flavohemoprotein [Oceanobacillus iheyensis]Q8ETH0.1 RecName: Full=Flavohemoprotein; AltName: Full=Flavohemoglobin; AltName: Full=Hemoglobin-like protein; AltName: Full=Nitric oxide dioxygenase; Short=NO oxygenase; Short=NOD [Oceanobacillus iheyensis HTE831]BAC12247.1 flavohemoglobin [Oceanobacillus iheyensis HTE831]
MSNTTVLLDKKTTEIIKATVPVLKEHGEAITKHFYKILLENNPELKNVFNQTNQRKGAQSKALANTVYAAAANIEKLEEILPHVKQIAHKHVSLNIKPEQYPIVGKYLLIAIKEVLGDAATDEIIEAWEKAYFVIADIFISVEKEMYNEKKNQIGGWTGFRDFKVIKKVKESKEITSFYLKPDDNLPITTFIPGQYITIKAQIESEAYVHLRQYSLSTAPGKDYYRISVKREASNQPIGVVSNYLHTSVEVGSVLPISAPAGDFILDERDHRPLVLISGGVGLTPIMSMLESVVEHQPNRNVVFIHAAKSIDHQAMRKRVSEIAKSKEQVKQYVVYSNPTNRTDGDKQGYIDYEWLKEVIPTKDAAFYLCGPKPFMSAINNDLQNMNIAQNDIHMELFGPLEPIAK